MEYKAEDYINFIEQKRFDKISRNGMELIAIEFRELQKQGETLPIDNVSVALPSIESIEFCNWLEENGYKGTLNACLYLKNDMEYYKDVLYQHYTNLLEFGK
jgi:hypothetical protein